MRILFVLTALSLPALAAAQTTMTVDEFEAYVTGRTLSYGVNGEVYGAEEYRPNRRVTWSFLDGQCEEGRWYPQGDAICFLYDFDPDPHCWRFYLGSGGLRAEVVGDTGPSTLYEVGEQDVALGCIGPEVGV